MKHLKRQWLGLALLWVGPLVNGADPAPSQPPPKSDESRATTERDVRGRITGSKQATHALSFNYNNANELTEIIIDGKAHCQYVRHPETGTLTTVLDPSTKRQAALGLNERGQLGTLRLPLGVVMADELTPQGVVVGRRVTIADRVWASAHARLFPDEQIESIVGDDYRVSYCYAPEQRVCGEFRTGPLAYIRTATYPPLGAGCSSEYLLGYGQAPGTPGVAAEDFSNPQSPICRALRTPWAVNGGVLTCRLTPQVPSAVLVGGALAGGSGEVRIKVKAPKDLGSAGFWVALVMGSAKQAVGVLHVAGPGATGKSSPLKSHLYLTPRTGAIAAPFALKLADLQQQDPSPDEDLPGDTVTFLVRGGGGMFVVGSDLGGAEGLLARVQTGVVPVEPGKNFHLCAWADFGAGAPPALTLTFDDLSWQPAVAANGEPPPALLRQATYSDMAQPTAITNHGQKDLELTWNAGGGLTTLRDPGRVLTLEWDVLHRLTGVTVERLKGEARRPVAKHAYRYLASTQLRVAAQWLYLGDDGKPVSQGETNYLYAGPTCVQQQTVWQRHPQVPALNGQTVTTRYLWLGDQLLWEETAGAEPRVYLRDLFDNVTGIYDGKTVTDLAIYDRVGRRPQPTQKPSPERHYSWFGYGSLLCDPTGLILVGGHIYSTDLGCLIDKSPILLELGY